MVFEANKQNIQPTSQITWERNWRVMVITNKRNKLCWVTRGTHFCLQFSISFTQCHRKAFVAGKRGTQKIALGPEKLVAHTHSTQSQLHTASRCINFSSFWMQCTALECCASDKNTTTVTAHHWMCENRTRLGKSKLFCTSSFGKCGENWYRCVYHYSLVCLPYVWWFDAWYLIFFCICSIPRNGKYWFDYACI